MEKSVNDRRTIRTKKAIREAFTALIIEKEYEEITVTELAERANINRKTFYSHYDCIEDVLYELQIGIVEKLIEIYKKHNSGLFDVQSFTVTLSEMLSENYMLYRRLVVANSYRFFSRGIKDTLKQAIMEQFVLRVNVKEEVLDFVTEFCVSGLFKVYKTWFEGGGELDAQTLARLVSTVVWGAIRSVAEVDEFKKTR